MSQEVYYNKVVEKTFKMIVDRTIHYIKTREHENPIHSVQDDKRWAMKVRKGYKALVLMEKHKEAGPWFSNCFKVIQ
jgi:hypothetical protein